MNKGEDMKPHAIIVYEAMMRGEVLTNQISKQRYSVEALSQRCGELNKSPLHKNITSERVPGKPYNRHYIKGALNSATRQPGTPIQVKSHVRSPAPFIDDQPSFGW
jgi:hypothetical protein